MSAPERDNHPSGHKVYWIGDVGDGARVQVGEYNTMLEIRADASPAVAEWTQRIEGLLEKIAGFEADADTKEMAIEKTRAVAGALAEAEAEPGKLKRALLDAKGWLGSVMHWAWDELATIMKSDAVQTTLSTIADAGVKSALLALL